MCTDCYMDDCNRPGAPVCTCKCHEIANDRDQFEDEYGRPMTEEW